MPTPTISIGDLTRSIRTISDFPKPGIQFKDITPVLSDGRLFQGLVHLLAEPYAGGRVELIAGIDARGFILASAVACHLGVGFIPIRKQGKLPYETHQESYSLEYGTNTIEIHQDAVRKGQRVMLIDDLLATGGTAAAAVKLLQRLGAEIVEVAFFVELGFLGGRRKIGNNSMRSVVCFD